MEPPESNGFFLRLRKGLQKTREGFVLKVDRLLAGKPRLDDQTVETLEEVLLAADFGVETSMQLIGELEKGIRSGERDKPQAIKAYLQENIWGILRPREAPLELGDQHPFVLMTIGVNGVGKTTTIAKIGKAWKDRGKKVLLAAGDTYRAAAIEQLQVWGDRSGVEVVRQQRGADPSAVVFDALQAARSRSADLVVLDTAGRLHTKVNLMDELKKIQRVAGRVVAGAPHEVLLVLDATTGQNALSQARMFHEAIGVTGIALTKLDGTAKGGILVAVASELKIPVRYIGVGENLEDLQTFQAKDFVEALFGDTSEI